MEIDNWFHWKNGWYFVSNPDYSVSIYRKNPNLPADKQPFLLIMKIPSNEWCSIIGHLAAGTDSDLKYQKAINFHEGKEDNENGGN